MNNNSTLIFALICQLISQQNSNLTQAQVFAQAQAQVAAAAEFLHSNS